MIKGLKKAVGDYKRANADGRYSARYGRLMLDRGTGSLWTDEFYSLGHNSWTEYKDPAIINLISWIDWEGLRVTDEVNMANVREWADLAIKEYEK